MPITSSPLSSASKTIEVVVTQQAVLITQGSLFVFVRAGEFSFRIVRNPVAFSIIMPYNFASKNAVLVNS